jgi:NADH dehydrogenase/NADH:ubiquinone oxidoreductase subunit G
MQITIDDKSVSAESGETILDVARREGIDIPALCHLPEMRPPSTSCLVCLVKLNGKFVPSCAVPVEEGMNIESETDEVRTMRQAALELLLSDHIAHCRTCGEGRKKCRLLKYMAKYKADRHRFGSAEPMEVPVQNDREESARIVFDSQKCIKCGICLAITRKHGEEMGLTFLGRGFATRVGVPFDESLQKGIEKSADEIIPACPTAALTWRVVSEPQV